MIKRLPQQPSQAVRPIGYVRAQNVGFSHLEILSEYREGLDGLQGFSHAWVLWWCHRTAEMTQGRALRVDPPFDAPRLGVFASRSPIRPNPIALTVVRLSRIRLEEGILETSSIDAYDGAPLLDIKPYMPHYDRVRSPRVPAWAAAWPRWFPDSGFEPDERPAG